MSGEMVLGINLSAMDKIVSRLLTDSGNETISLFIIIGYMEDTLEILYHFTVPAIRVWPSVIASQLVNSLLVLDIFQYYNKITYE